MLPKDVARIVEVEREGLVREGGVNVHDAVDDEGRALVAVEQAGREGPGVLQLLDVADVDLIVFAVVVRSRSLAGHHPVFFALRELDKLVICVSAGCNAQLHVRLPIAMQDADISIEVPTTFFMPI